MMFENSFCMPDVAKEIYDAIEAALATGIRTADIAKPGEKSVSTTEMTAAIVARI
jgi:3-isopropylmalate dehydrogenase